jgi:hypothetical protein
MPNSEIIARWLRPPDVPTAAAPERRDIWGSSFLVVILVVVVFLADFMFYEIGGWIVAVPVFIFGLAYGLNWIRRTANLPASRATIGDHERTLALRSWDRRMEAWERIGVCPNCGMLSDPVSGRTAEWHSVPSLFV